MAVKKKYELYFIILIFFFLTVKIIVISIYLFRKYYQQMYNIKHLHKKIFRL